MRLRAQLAAAAALCVLVAGGFGSWYARRVAALARGAADAPRFVEPGAGPRAPSAEAFGVALGRATPGEVRQRLAARGVDCVDRSVGAMLKQWREARRAEVAAAKSDAVSGASALARPSRLERNPQVRLSCETVRASSLGDWARPESFGRLLMVFDGPAQPLRHASFERTFSAPSAARRDLEQTRSHLAQRLGPPTRSANAASADLPWLTPVEYEWTFADLRAVVTAINYGGRRGVVVSETVEVPWPVRADAPWTQKAVAFDPLCRR